MYSIEEKTVEFLKEIVPYLGSSDLRDLLDYIDLDDIMEYVEYSDKWRVISMEDFEDYEALKSNTISEVEEDENDLDYLKGTNLRLRAILENAENLKRFLDNTSEELRVTYEKNQTIINESNSNK